MNYFENAKRVVTSVSINNAGYISRLWNDDGDWPPQDAFDALTDIELGEHTYWVEWPDEETEVVGIDDDGGRYLSTLRADSGSNALLELPRHPERHVAASAVAVHNEHRALRVLRARRAHRSEQSAPDPAASSTSNN